MIVAIDEQSATLFHFGEFTLDLQRRGLFRHGERVHLTSKPLETLIYLVKNRDRAIEKRELLSAVWEGAFVTEDTLVHAVMEIRLALADNKDDPQFIQTVPRHGYRFVGIVSIERPRITANVAALPMAAASAPPEAQPINKSVDWKSHRVLLISALVIIAVFSVLYLVSKRSFQKPSQAQIPFQNAKLAKLTTNGKIIDAVVLPDGRYVVYAVSDRGLYSLWLKQIATASNLQITEPSDLSYQGLSISPGGHYLYYVGSNKKLAAALYRMPVLGGSATKLLEDIDSAITFSPDGKQIAFIRGYPQNGETALMVANSDGTEERKFVAYKRPNFFPTTGYPAPAWSPDGKVIACPAGKASSTERYVTLNEIQSADGTTKPLTPQRWVKITDVGWLSNGSGLILTAKENDSSPFQIWHVSYPDGKPSQLTNDLSNYRGVSLSADSKTLLTLHSQSFSNIWTSPDGSANKARQLTSNNVDGLTALAWTPDARLVYDSRAAGKQDIWIMDQNGEHQRQLTRDVGENSWPSVSPDGRYIVFMSNRTGMNHIWRMNIDGTNPTQLTNGKDERWPSCSPDNRSVVFASSDGLLKLFRVSIEGGDWTQVTTTESSQPAISPDGNLVVTAYFDTQNGIKMGIYPIGGGPPLKILDVWSSYFQWAPDGRSIHYVNRESVANIISQPVNGAAPKPLTSFTAGGISAFAWSRSGQLAWSTTTIAADVVVLNDQVTP